MKNLLLIICLICFTICNAIGQDILTKKDGTDIHAKIMEIGTTEVKFKKFNNPDGPTFTLSKTDLLMVRYENGTKDIFTETNPSTSQSNNKDMCSKGKQDSKLNYRGKNSGAGWTTATTILFSPVLGVIPAAVCGASEPSEDNLNYRNHELMKNDDYYRCYKQEAHKTKKKKLWRNFGIGSGVWLLL